jgi:hypothetical protein
VCRRVADHSAYLPLQHSPSTRPCPTARWIDTPFWAYHLSQHGRWELALRQTLTTGAHAFDRGSSTWRGLAAGQCCAGAGHRSVARHPLGAPPSSKHLHPAVDLKP